MASYKGTTIKPGTDAEVSEQIKSIDGSLSAGSLATQKPFDLTQPKPATEAAGALAAIGANANSFTQNLAETAKTREASLRTSEDTFMQALLAGEGETALTAKAYAPSVDPLEMELKDINQQILAEQVGLQRRLERLDQNTQGLFGTGLEQERTRIENESLRKQADLSVIQMAKLGRYDSAKAIADRAVKAQLESKAIQLEALKFNYEKNKDLFTTAEQRAFEVAQGDRERELEMEAYKEKARFDQIIQQNDPKYQAELAKLNAEAGGGATSLGLAQAEGSIQEVSSLLTDDYLTTAVGPNALARVSFLDPFTGGKSNFIAGVEQLRSQLSLDSLINAKANGATFGALSEGELKLLQESGSKLSSWAKKDKEGNVTGYKTNEADFKNELQKIQNFKTLDYILKGGDPASAGAVIQADGTVWVRNWDGSLTQIY